MITKVQERLTATKAKSYDVLRSIARTPTETLKSQPFETFWFRVHRGVSPENVTRGD